MSDYDDPAVRHSYRSPLVDRLREAGELRAGRLRLLMPRSFGFCWGVDRALAMVRDARATHGGRPMWLINSIIHNPRVNEDMQAMGIGFLKGPRRASGALEQLGPRDVVVVPAFSAEVEEMELLRERGVEIVDTTCPWVIKPHKRAARYVREGFTTVIHGTVGHDETRATCSLVRHHGGHYVVVHDMAEAEALARFLEGTSGEEELRAGLHPAAIAPGFAPAHHLRRIGVINQTTMLASESRAIAERLRRALAARDGDEGLSASFRDFDTICAATQDNQDAAEEVAAKHPDLFIVVGGYDSSNTRNLARVGDGHGVPAYHVEGPESLERELLRHRDRHSGQILEERGWLPAAGELAVAFSAGASTPDAILGRVVARVVELAGETLPADWHGGAAEV